MRTRVASRQAAGSSLIRPGPIQGGAVHPYLERKKRLREDPSYEIPYEHPSLEPILSDTLGAIVFQDQVIQVAMALATFSSGEAEGLLPLSSGQLSPTGEPTLCTPDGQYIVPESSQPTEGEILPTPAPRFSPEAKKQIENNRLTAIEQDQALHRERALHRSSAIAAELAALRVAKSQIHPFKETLQGQLGVQPQSPRV